MNPIVSIIMGSTSDLPVMEKACKLLNEMQVPFEVNALSAHRTPEAVEEFARNAKGRGIRVIIAAAGMAAALPGVIAASTTLPVIGVPIKGMLDGLDAMLSIIQMPHWHPCCYRGSKRCPECSYPCCRDACPERRSYRTASERLQKWTERENRQGKQRTC